MALADALLAHGVREYGGLVGTMGGIMKKLVDAETSDVAAVAARVNELIAGYDYLLAAVQAAEPHAIADVAKLRQMLLNQASRIIELEADAELGRLVRKMPPGAVLWHMPESCFWQVRFPDKGEEYGSSEPETVLRIALGETKGEEE